MKVHVMHVIDSLAVGGAERMLVEIANNTNRDNFKVSVCVTRSDITLANELKSDISLYVLNRKSRFDIQGLKKLSIIVKNEKIDILHVHGRSSFALTAFANSLGLVSSPIILHDHFGAIEVDNSIPIWFRLWGKRKLKHYVGVYQRLAEWARRAGIPFHKISVIENALDLSRISNAVPYNLRQNLNISKQVLIGVFVGGLRREKGLDILIDALSITRFHSKMKILVIGAIQDNSYFQTCKEKINQRSLSETIMFLGCRTDVPRILKSVDFAVIPSISESGPLVLIEYMAAGLPFVASRVGAISLRAEELGVPGFVTPGDPEAFAQALDELLSLSSIERAERGNIGQQIAFQYFDIRKKMPQWYEVYARVFGRDIN